MRARGDRRRGRDRSGFMLVEALSALAISALLIAALLSFTGLLRRSADRAALRVETMEASGRTVWTIASEIRQATRARWAPEQRDAAAATPTEPAQAPAARTDGRSGGRNAGVADPDAEIDRRNEADQQNEARSAAKEGADLPPRNFVFAGGPDRLIFALAPEQADGLRAPVMVAYQIDPSGAVLRAEGAIRPQDKGPGDVRLGAPLRVDPGPERLRFAYVEREPSGIETVVDAWTDSRRMPVAIRIDRLDPASGVVVGSLSVPILLSGEPGCADPDQGFCSRVERTSKEAGGRQPAARPGGQGGGQAGGGEPE